MVRNPVRRAGTRRAPRRTHRGPTEAEHHHTIVIQDHRLVRHKKGGVSGKRGLARRPAETLTAAGGVGAILAIIYGVFPHMSQGTQKAVTAIITAVVALIPAITSAIHDYIVEQHQIAEDMAYIRTKLEADEGREEEMAPVEQAEEEEEQVAEEEGAGSPRA
jgi:hypothetical protein